MKGKKLSGAMICIVVSLVVMFAFTGCNPDVKNPDFAGGDGSAASPYIIKNVEQLKNVAKYAADSLYYKLGNDISVPYETYIKNFNGTLDGGNNKIKITGATNSIALSACALIENCSGTIKNLTYDTVGMKAISLNSKNMTYQKVTTTGKIAAIDNNVAAFTVFPFESVAFENCKNEAPITDEPGGTHYGAAFIGGYVKSSPCSITFTDCTNSADIYFGEWASVFLGNPSLQEGYATPIITFAGCSNTGNVIGGKEAAIVKTNGTWTNNYANPEGFSNSGSGTIEKLAEVTGFSATLKGDKSYEVTLPSTTNIVKYSIVGTVRVNFGDADKADKVGQTFTVEIAKGANNELIGSVSGLQVTSDSDKATDDILLIDTIANLNYEGCDRWVLSGSTDDPHIAPLTGFKVIGYDNTGKVVALKSITVANN